LCKAEDFSRNEETEEIFEISEQNKLNYYCPAFEDYSGDVTLSGSRNNMKQKTFEFQIFRCDHRMAHKANKTHKCASS